MLAMILTAACAALLTMAGAILLARAGTGPFAVRAGPEAVARRLLNHPTWRWRSFRILKLHLGGFGDDELRRILVGAGAVRFETEPGEEIWGLYERVAPLLEGPRYPVIGKAFTAIDEAVLTPEVQREVRILVAEGRRTIAVDRLRAATGLGLTRSVALLERL